MLYPFKLIPTYRDYVWGGKRLRRDADITAEAWVVYEEDKVADGIYSGKTLAEVADVEGEALLGSRAVARTGKRFPLLIKLLDCARWLSLQVHPNDEQAELLEGPGYFGKTEAWYVIEADEGAQLFSGFRPGVTREDIHNAVGNKTILDLVECRNVKAGDTIFIAPGTIHALGPGLLIYEVQQTSDLTYRVYDWDRPATGTRKLHIEQSIAVLDPEAGGVVLPANPGPAASGRKELVSCKYFTLELLAGRSAPIPVDMQGKSFSAVTTLNGSITVEGRGWSFDLKPLETLLIPAGCGAYQVITPENASALLAYAALEEV
jgi:mannose-6-phosphate isomerase